MNEELHASNEELQTMNEELDDSRRELQDFNVELQAMNDELLPHTDELNQANAFLHAILGGLHAAVIVLDRTQSITLWDTRSEELWGIRADEARGQCFCNLAIGLPVVQLKDPIAAVLRGASAFQEVILEAIDRHGMAIQCRVTCGPLHGAAGQIDGVVLSTEIERSAAAL